MPKSYTAAKKCLLLVRKVLKFSIKQMLKIDFSTSLLLKVFGTLLDWMTTGRKSGFIKYPSVSWGTTATGKLFNWQIWLDSNWNNSSWRLTFSSLATSWPLCSLPVMSALSHVNWKKVLLLKKHSPHHYYVRALVGNANNSGIWPDEIVFKLIYK